MDKKDVVVLFILFLAAFWLWTLPSQKNPLPFGEGDAAYHFGIGDYASYIDKTLTKRPPYMWYGGPAHDPLSYPPTPRENYAYAQILGGERFVPLNIYIAIISFLGIFSAYFLVRKLYGFTPALIVGAGLLFSHREILSYLWGQRPNITAGIYIPLIIYTYYKYLRSFYKNQNKPIYLYMFALLLSSLYLFHLGPMLLVIPIIVVYTLLISFKEKRLPIDKSNLKYVLISLLIIVLVCLPFWETYVVGGAGIKPFTEDLDLTRLFHWLKPPPDNFSLNPSFINFEDTYGSKYIIVLILLGVIFLLLRRKDKDLLIISSLIGLYIALHMDVILLTRPTFRLARFLMVEPYFFYTCIALGIMFILSFIGIRKRYKQYLNYLAAMLFIIFTIVVVGKPTYSLLYNAYGGLGRITPYQYDVAEWISENTDEGTDIYTDPGISYHYFGSLSYGSFRFINMISRRNADGDNVSLRYYVQYAKQYPEWNRTWNFTHTVFDYSGYYILKNQQELEKIQQLENSIKDIATLVYDKNLIRVYEYD